MQIKISLLRVFFVISVIVIYFNFILRNSFRINKRFLKCKPNEHSLCFLDMMICHPGYSEDNCLSKLEPTNLWFIKNCPNLKQNITYDSKMSHKLFVNLSDDSYLCFLHPDFGIGQIPLKLWIKLREKESFLRHKKIHVDKSIEHLEGFDNYKNLPIYLGNFLEVGCGPYTQAQYIIDYKFESITLLDRLAYFYSTQFPGCNFKNESLFGKKIKTLSFGIEGLANEIYLGKYDTIMSINGMKDVYDGYEFLTNIYNALKPGGILIIHERFYAYPIYGDRIGGHKNSGPVRLTKIVYDHFLSKFKQIYKFEGQTLDQIKSLSDENGLYFIGTKI